MKCPYCEGSGDCEPTFGARIRACRNDLEETQEGVARRLGISRAQLANLEVGRSEPSLAVLIKSAEFFGKSADWLLGRGGGTEHAP